MHIISDDQGWSICASCIATRFHSYVTILAVVSTLFFFELEV